MMENDELWSIVKLKLSSCEVTVIMNEKNDGHSFVTRNIVKVCLPSINKSIKGNKGKGGGQPFLFASSDVEPRKKPSL